MYKDRYVLVYKQMQLYLHICTRIYLQRTSYVTEFIGENMSVEFLEESTLFIKTCSKFGFTVFIDRKKSS